MQKLFRQMLVTISVIVFLSGLLNCAVNEVRAWEIERDHSAYSTRLRSGDGFASDGFAAGGRPCDSGAGFIESPKDGSNWSTVVGSDSRDSDRYGSAEPAKEVDPSDQNQDSEPLSINAAVNRPEVLDLIDILLSAKLPAEMPPTLYMNSMTKVQYAGAVSMAMEGMRLVRGDMDEEREVVFESRWLPLFRYPGQEIVFYVNQLNPLLVKFLALRAALNDCIEDFNATQFAVMSCTDIGDAFGLSEAMESATIYALIGKVLNIRLQLVGKEILALGGPPDPAGLMRKARAEHEATFAEFTRKPVISITPVKLDAVPGREYTFRIEIADYDKYKNSDKLSLTCQGREKIKNGILIVKKTFHKKIGAHEKFTVQLHQYPGPRVLATVTAEITMVKNSGRWTLVECHTYKTDPGPSLTTTIDQKDCRIETSFAPSSFSGNVLRFGYISRWKTPLKKLSPKTEMRIPISITRNHSCAVCQETRAKLSSDAYNAHGKEKTEILEKLADYETSLYNCYDKSNHGVSITVSLITDPKLSKRVENNPFNNGSLNRSVAELKSGNHRTETSLTQTVPSGIQEDRYDKNRPNLIFLHVQIKNSFYFSKNCDDINRESHSTVIAGVVYTYKWDPGGNQIEPLNVENQGVAGAPTNPVGLAAGASEKAEKIIFHQHNIKYFATNIEAIKKQIVNVGDHEARDRLVRDLLYAQDARQRERDAIAEIKTGQFVRTRTALDALNMKMMADESRKIESKWHTIKRIMERGPRLIKLAPESEQAGLSAFFKRQVTVENVCSGKSEKLSQAMNALGDKILGSIEGEIEGHLEEAQFWDENLKMAQYTKTGAEYTMMVLSFTGASGVYNLFGSARLITASGVYMGYGATSGAIEGYSGEGVEGAIKGAITGCAAGYNTATTIINAGMQGYQAGVLQHLEDYAQNPQKVKLDEEKAGFKGAAWSAGTAAAFAVGVKFGVKAYQNRQQIIKNRQTLSNLKFDKVKQDFRVRHFKRRTVAAAEKVKAFRLRQEALSRAGQTNAPKSEILRLRCQLDQAYKDVKTDYFSKKIMKSMAVKAKADYKTASGRARHKTVHAYNSIDRRFTKQLKTRLAERMAAAGYNQQRYKTFSNSASKGGIGMDVDMGAVPAPGQSRTAWRRGLARTVKGKVRSVSPQELQRVGQEQLEGAFEDIYGRKPGEAMISYTTTYHPEAYRDPRWLGSKRLKMALVYQTDPRWTQQAADVTDFKINTMNSHNPSLSYYGAMQENCRGLVKDMNTKLEPLLKQSKNLIAVKHMRKLKRVMDQFSRNKIGPVKAEQQLRILTGNREGIREVSQRFSCMLQGLKLPAASR